MATIKGEYAILKTGPTVAVNALKEDCPKIDQIVFL